MEPLTSSKRLILLAVAVTLSVVVGFLAYHHLFNSPLQRNDLPTLELNVKLLNSNGKPIEAKDSLIAGTEETPAGDDRCPALKGGDVRFPSVASSDEQRPADCPRVATWYVKKHPVALTLYFNDGKSFLQWWDKQPQINALVDNRFTQGLFFGLLKSLTIKAEQLKLQGLKGEFLMSVLRDAISANAELHYDMVHAKRGWVLSYKRDEGTYSQQAVPVMARLLAGNAYRIAKLPAPILEMRIGVQRFFMTEYRRRIYLAQSLEALLNVIESVAPTRARSNVPLSLIFRADAVIDKLLPVWLGTSASEARLDFELQDGKLGTLVLPRGPWSRALHDKLFEGVLAAIPHDAFAAAATSLTLPPSMTIEDWRELADKGPAASTANKEPGGVAVVWDFDADNPHGAIGVIVANPTAPEASPAYSQYLKNPELGAECGGGSVFLAATSQGLLTRMREACERQSLSPLDWQRASEKPRYLSSQLVTFINPGTGIRQLFLAGGAGNSEDADEFAPRWKREYEQAKAAMQKEGDKLFSDLPIFSYAGRLGNDGPILLEGRLITQEIKQ